MQNLDMLMRLAGENQQAQYDDPLLQLASSADTNTMLEELGIPYPENPYEYIGMEQPVGNNISDALTREVLGSRVPTLAQDQLVALASALGVDNKDPMLDPMRTQQFDIMTLLGGR